MNGVHLDRVGRPIRQGPSAEDDPLGAFIRVRDQVQADRIDPADLTHLWKVIDLVGEEAIRYGFGPALQPPPNADEQTRLLAHLGRTE